MQRIFLNLPNNFFHLTLKLLEPGQTMLLHPRARSSWLCARASFNAAHPNAPRPILRCTFRPALLQWCLYHWKNTARKRPVTLCKPGKSLHNQIPARAFDVTFSTEDEVKHLIEFAAIAKRFGLDWGGDWQNIKDYRHFQLPTG